MLKVGRGFKMASDGAKWSKDEIGALIDAYSDAKTSADPMTTNRELYNSINGLLEQNNDVQRSTKQIETKVKKLKSGYSKLKDRMKVSGAERPYDSKSLTSVEKVAFQHWDKLDRILGRLSYVIVKIIMHVWFSSPREGKEKWTCEAFANFNSSLCKP